MQTYCEGRSGGERLMPRRIRMVSFFKIGRRISVYPTAKIFQFLFVLIYSRPTRKEGERMNHFLKQELSGWKKSEVIWMFAAALTILTLSFYWKDSAVGIIAAVTGVLCVILTGKGKISSYIFGMINTVLYAYVAFGAKYYGEVMLNLLYYVPMNIVGWYAWRKNMNAATCEVVKRKLSIKVTTILFLGTTMAIVIYGAILSRMGGNLPYVDSVSTVLSVAAQILCVRRYREQWLLWIVVNTVTIIMWVFAFWNGGESVATLLMWSIYLINAVIMYQKWSREAKVCDIK